MRTIRQKVSSYAVFVLLVFQVAGCIPSSSVFISFSVNDEALDEVLATLCGSLEDIGFDSGRGCSTISRGSTEMANPTSWKHLPVLEFASNKRIRMEIKFKELEGLVQITFTEVEVKEFSDQATDILGEVKSVLDNMIGVYNID